ncbi:60S ribosomal protein L6, variant 2 [Salvia divinorum]|uniref:60S ribosomal protein L6, variant 2 n=1 Tax=Salvia divinorum TaxID=28513 RepID=A0ABD1FT00_SALDI
MAPKQKTRNPELIPGVRKVSRSQMYHKRGLWAIKAKNGGKFPVHAKLEALAAVEEKQPKCYPADDIKKPLSNKRTPKPTKLRASVTPGTVLIILTGRFKGKRVVFLKQLTSGLLLVLVPTGSTFDDKYFGKQAEKKKKKGETEFFEADKQEKNTLPAEKKDDQKAVDALLLKALESVPDLKAYLGARFSLKAGMKPHELVF